MNAISTLGDRMERRFGQMDLRFGQMDQRFNGMDQRFKEMDQRFKEMDQRFNELQAEQRRHTEAIAEVRGELRGLSAWLSSMDQRFVAIMRPYEPPRQQRQD